MKSIPSQLECAYCLRNRNVGGECRSEQKLTGCLAFKANPLGCIKRMQTCLLVPLYHDIPFVGEWSDDWEIKGNETKFKIEKINGTKWDSRRGYLKLYVDIAYFENEYADDFKESKMGPVLKLIK